MDIKDFLLARIAEDELAAARHLKTWANADDDVDNFEGATIYLAPQRSLRHDNEYMAMRIGYGRVLAECEAKRELVDIWHDEHGGGHVLKTLATVYSDHPDYQQKWSF